MDKIKEYAKFVASIIGAVLTGGAAALSVIPEPIRPWLTIILLVATAISVFAVPNAKDQTADEEAGDSDPTEQADDDGAGDVAAVDPDMEEASAVQVDAAFADHAA